MPPAGEVPQCRGAGGRLHHRKGAHFQGISYNLLLNLPIYPYPVPEPDLNPDPT